ncbi:MAG: ClpXP protease specificity-enhancing factor SspB [Amphiplicatus sp.]
MSDVEFDYDYLTQRALRQVVKDVLEMTAEIGATPGEHHFYIEFATQAPGVIIPDELIETYPERMTIVVQHQFENLVVRDDEFALTLWFKGIESRLTIPFEAVTSFADPSVQFGL